jgi:hypothetical protein
MPRKRRTNPNNLTINVTPELCSEKIIAGFPHQNLSSEEANNEFIAYVNDLVSLDLLSITPSQYERFLNFLESMSCNVYENTIDVKYLPMDRMHISIAISLVTTYPLILKVFPEPSVLSSEAGFFAPKKQQTAEILSTTPAEEKCKTNSALNEEENNLMDSIEPVSFWLCTLV